jgi:hemerythrin
MAEIQIWLTYHIANDDSGYKECVQEMLSNRAEQAAKERRWFKTLFR